ncbi:hypothetical protein K435DRAFT_880668 [Dendrothele bispora CBS 962.96]|uniref:Uncharacterized protein n=1 Tax=Dendrothele bispora (strain CBS 962.96) TaxID=1314807 RepID=A0A4S8KK73_DENBC|nr:hypothetical protein K435DRAFT_880668 [Dendrothele bispora CBS 962.96]
MGSLKQTINDQFIVFETDLHIVIIPRNTGNIPRRPGRSSESSQTINRILVDEQSPLQRTHNSKGKQSPLQTAQNSKANAARISQSEAIDGGPIQYESTNASNTDYCVVCSGKRECPWSNGQERMFMRH